MRSSRLVCLTRTRRLSCGPYKRTRRCVRRMSEQARRVRNEAIPEWAQGLYYNKGLFDEALVYYDEEALYFESRGKDSGIVRFSFDMLETLKQVVEDEEEGAG